MAAYLDLYSRSRIRAPQRSIQFAVSRGSVPGATIV